MQTMRYSSRLREDGSLRLSPHIRQKLGLQTGENVEIDIYPANDMDELIFLSREGYISPDQERQLDALILKAKLTTRISRNQKGT